jgi:hypothetical protein
MRTRIITLMQFTFRLAAGAVLLTLAGCSSRPAVASLPAAKQGDFQLSIASVSANSSIDLGNGRSNRSVQFSGQFADLRGGRVVTVGRYLEWDELRDERGRDLFALSEKHKREYPEQQRDDHTMFIWKADSQSETSFRCQVTSYLGNLPEMPRAISVARGRVRGFVALELASFDFDVEPTADWIELAPGLAFRIDSVEAGWPVEVTYSLQADPDEPSASEHVRHWFAFKELNYDGKTWVDESAHAEEIGPGVHRRVLKVFTKPPPGGKNKLRVSLTGDVEEIHFPFEFRDIWFE